MIKAIVFDCFGVFISDGLLSRVAAVDQVNPEAGRALHDIIQAINRGMITKEESTRQMAEIFGTTPEELRSELDGSVVKNDDLIAYAKSLKPTYKLALLSNVRGRTGLEELFKPDSLDELFDVVVASGDVGYIKPESQIYELTAERLGVDTSECVMIDDLPSYCEGAEAVGMRAIRFVSTDQCERDLDALIDR